MNNHSLYATAMTMRLEMQFCRWFLHEADTRYRLIVLLALLERGYGVPDLPFFLTVIGDHKLHHHSLHLHFQKHRQ